MTNLSGNYRDEITEQDIDEVELRAELEQLEKSVEEQDAALTDVQSDLDELLLGRGSVATEIRRRQGRLAEIQELAGRFKLLEEHYISDLRRLEAIQESGSLFAHFERESCPLCGANPTDQHLSEDCDGNVEKIVQAAIGEMQKIRRLVIELEETVESLNDEVDRIEGELPALAERYRAMDTRLSEIVRPQVASQRGSYNELLIKKTELMSSLGKLARFDRLVAQRTELEIGEDGVEGSRDIRTSITKDTLDAFSQTVERILAEWHYPSARRVFFDEGKKDFQIAGKERGSTGKGLRAITHAAVSIAIMEFLP